MEEILKKYEMKEENIIPILTEVQEMNSFNYISESDIEIIAKKVGITKSKIYSLITFYSYLSDKPQGKYVVQLCSVASCYINGAFNMLEVLKDELKIAVDETTDDRLFSLKLVSCLGCCDKAPVMRINKKIYDNLTAEKIKEILNEYRSGENGA